MPNGYPPFVPPGQGSPVPRDDDHGGGDGDDNCCCRRGDKGGASLGKGHAGHRGDKGGASPGKGHAGHRDGGGWTTGGGGWEPRKGYGKGGGEEKETHEELPRPRGTAGRKWWRQQKGCLPDVDGRHIH